MYSVTYIPYRAYFLRWFYFANYRNLDFMDLFFTNCSLGHTHKRYPAPLAISPTTRRRQVAIKGSVAKHQRSACSLLMAVSTGSAAEGALLIPQWMHMQQKFGGSRKRNCSRAHVCRHATIKSRHYFSQIAAKTQNS